MTRPTHGDIDTAWDKSLSYLGDSDLAGLDASYRMRCAERQFAALDAEEAEPPRRWLDSAAAVLLIVVVLGFVAAVGWFARGFV